MLWVAVSADQYELPYAVAESGSELAQMLHTTPYNIYQLKARNTNGKICGYRVITVKLKEDEAMKYRILEAFQEYLMGTMNKNTARKYYTSVKSIFRDADFKSLDEVDPAFIQRQMEGIVGKNEFSAAKMGLLKLKEFEPALALPKKQFFSDQEKLKKNYVKSRGQKIYKDTILRKINKVRDLELRLAYRLGIVSGLRVSELAALKPKDIHLSGEQIQIYVENGKGGKSGEVTCLQDLYVKEKLEQLVNGKMPDTTLFPTAGHMMNEASRLGFECHDLRRIFAQDLKLELLEQGKTKQEAEDCVRVELRHSKIKTTNIYLRGRTVVRDHAKSM